MNSTFGLYFAFLTAALVIYYAVVILMDLFKKDKNTRDDEEIIPVGDDDVEPSTSVSLDGGNIRFGNDAVEEPAGEVGDDDGQELEDTGGDDADDEGGDDLFETPEEETAFNDYDEGENSDLTEEQEAILRQRFTEGMEEIEAQYQTVVNSTEFHFMMCQPRGAKNGLLREFVDD